MERRIIEMRSLNIYDIMETLLNASMKTAGNDERRFSEEFHKLVTRVPASWEWLILLLISSICYSRRVK